MLKKILPLLFLGLVALFLWKNLKDIDLSKVLTLLGSLPLPTLLLASGLVFLDYGFLVSFECLAFRTLFKKPLKRLKKLAFICYAFNLNLGSLVGGLGMRHRLYGREGLALGAVNSVIVFSTSTNWLGHLLLTGSLCLLRSTRISELFGVQESFVQLGGSFLLCGVVAYFVFCSQGSKARLRNWSYDFPPLRIALLQLGLALCQWTLLGFILSLVLQGLELKVSYLDVLSGLLLSGFIGLFLHVPAGLGVLEAVFLSLDLSAPKEEILAGLLAYRALYYLVPLIVGVSLFVSEEVSKKGRKGYLSSSGQTFQ